MTGRTPDVMNRFSAIFDGIGSVDLKDRGRDGESNKAFPLTPPSPPGRGRTCERFVNVRGMLASIPRIEARRQGGPTNTYTTERLGALSPSRRAEWFSLSLGERVGVRGKGLPGRLRLPFPPLAPISIPPKIARNHLEYPLWMMRKPPVPLWNNPHRRRVECSLGEKGLGEG